ncbi:MAG: type II secretion system GspH family protein [Actinobacteria bacterium]|nr:type II secretion system GspH family protein [Actinomycetota bacterium]
MRKGFTLIELLVVVALIGALSVALLASIDPFEQIKKGNDTTYRNIASEFYNASLRYYAISGSFPWGTANFGPSNLSAMSSYITTLASVGELKSKFFDLASESRLAKIDVYMVSSDQVSVCFKPESKNFKLDNNTQFNVSGVMAAGCNTSTSACYWCIQ